MDVSFTAREAVARVDKFYLWRATTKRLEAAQEALDQIAGAPGMDRAVEVVRQTVASAPDDRARVPMLRAGLAEIGERSAVLASGEVAPLAGLALAVYGASPSPATGRAALDALSFDPLARAFSNAGGAGECLTPLTEARRDAAFGASLGTLPEKARLAGQRLVVSELGSGLLQALPDEALQPGLKALAAGEPLVPGLANGLPAPECLASADTLLAAVSPAWQDWTRQLMDASPDDRWRGLALQTCLRFSHQDERAPAVAALLKGSPPEELGAALSRGLGELHPRLAAWDKLAPGLGLTGHEQARGALAQVENADLKPYQAAAQLLAPEKAGALLGEMARSQDTASLAAGFEALLAGGSDPRAVLAALGKPLSLLERVGGLDAVLPKSSDRLATAAACLGAWLPMAATVDEADALTMAQTLAAADYREPSKAGDALLRALKPATCKGDGVALLAQKHVGGISNPVDHNQAAEAALTVLAGRHPEVVELARAACDAVPGEDQKKTLLTRTLKDLAEVPGSEPLGYARRLLKAGQADATHALFARVAAGYLAEHASGPQQAQLALAAALAGHRTGYPHEARSAIGKILNEVEASPACLPRKLAELTRKGTSSLSSDPADQLALGGACFEQIRLYGELRPDLPSTVVLGELAALYGERLSSPRQQQAWSRLCLERVAATDTHDPGWLAGTLAGVSSLDEASARKLAPALMKALWTAAGAYRDDKLAPPVLDRLQAELAGDGDPRPSLKKHLDELARYTGEAYALLAQSQPAQLKTVEEQADAVIVGGVRVKKASD